MTTHDHSQHQAIGWLHEIRKEKGMTQSNIANLIGVQQSTISRWLKNDPDYLPDRQNVESILKLYNDFFGVLPDADETKKYVDTRRPRSIAGRESRAPIEHLEVGGGANCVKSDEHQQNGNSDHRIRSDGFWLLPDSIMSGMRNSEHVKGIKVIGDSMEPTIPRGSTVFADTSDTYPSPDIYVVDFGDGLFVKRLQLVPQSSDILLISDNRSNYETHRIKRSDVQVFGRVVAWFQWTS
jgi:phage repressor protein C with HTH and peptisase S24 domain